MLVLALTATPATAQPLAALDGAIEALMEKAGVPGVVVAVLESDGTISERGYGVRSAETGEAVTTGTLFRNGSASKMWTAAALLRAMESRKLSVHAPIGSFVDGLSPTLARLTVHQLLSHQAGLADSSSGPGSLDDGALAASMRDPAAYSFLTDPGRIMSYSNPGYRIAGFVLEQLTGKPFADAVGELVLAPIGARHSMFRPLLAMTYPLAQGHTIAAGKAIVIRPMPYGAHEAPSGNASFTTAGDAARFAGLVLDSAGAGSGQVLSRALATAMVTPHVALAEAGGKLSYGYGFFIERRGGKLVWEHGGGIDGFNSMVTLFPESRTAIVVMANAGDGALVNAVRDLILTQRGLLTPAQGNTAKRAWPAVPTKLAAALVGQWGQGEYVFTIRQQGDVLSYLSGKTSLGTLRLAEQGRLAIIGPTGQFAGYVAVVPDAGGNPMFLQWGGRSVVRLVR